MSKKWFSGPPPSVGWWPASTIRRQECYRWWNGQVWSLAAIESESPKEAARAAKIKMSNHLQSDVEWQRRPKSWPARSRT